MSQPSFWWQRYGTLAQMAQAAVALLGFVAILIQINEIRTNNRASSARQAFLGYTDLAFKNPKKAAVFFFDVDSPGANLHGTQQVTISLGGQAVQLGATVAGRWQLREHLAGAPGGLGDAL